MLVEPDAGAGLGKERGQRDLSDLKRLAAQVVAVQFCKRPTSDAKITRFAVSGQPDDIWDEDRHRKDRLTLPSNVDNPISEVV
jgi:hypothetical protein